MATSYTVRRLAGRDYLDAATELLLTMRAKHLHAGLYEAGEIQWWWREGGVDDPNNQLFWYAADRQPVATLWTYRDADRWICDAFWLPTHAADVQRDLWPAMLARLGELPRDVPAEIIVDEREHGWAERLDAAGWRANGTGWRQMSMSLGQARSEGALPPGYSFGDATGYRPGATHHLAVRNGAQVFDRLRECSLYRPELDLCVIAVDGDVAGYCLCWLDARNRVGLFEPIRTEDAHQRRGLGRAIVHEGLLRLTEAGATAFKVSHRLDNVAAQALYEALGFTPQFCKYRFLRG